MKLLCILFSITFARGFDVIASEPEIQCTIIKVIDKGNLPGVKNFPELYQTVSNDSKTSRLFIAGKELKGINPVTLYKSSDLEKLSIKNKSISITLELSGKPISRKGTLKMNSKHLADLTCH